MIANMRFPVAGESHIRKALIMSALSARGVAPLSPDIGVRTVEIFLKYIYLCSL